jgi:outer membrane protein assembly factor BamB
MTPFLIPGPFRLASAICGLLLAAGLDLQAAATDWPQFRGPTGNGVSTATKLPLTWGENSNLKWKTPIHGKAWSSPVVAGDRIWLTTANEDGRELFVVSVDLATGKIVRDQKLFDVEKPQYCHPFNSYASPTPVIEGDCLYATFGAAGTACIDMRSGEIIWTRRDLECNHFRGAGSSPIIHGNLLFLNFDGSDKQFVVALEKATGRTAWQVNRSIDYKDLDASGKPLVDGDYRKAFATCQVIDRGGTSFLLSQGSKALYAYDPKSGEEIWRLEDRSSYSGSTRPVFGHGLIYCPSGFSSGEVLAVRPGRKGEVLDARSTNSLPGMELQVAWRTKRNAPKKPSLLLLGDLLFAVDDNGTATCWNALRGETLWSQNIGGHFSASPLAAAGRVYFFNEEGKTIVVAADRSFKKLAENQLGDGFMASPAVAGDELILRSRTHLYRVGE